MSIQKRSTNFDLLSDLLLGCRRLGRLEPPQQFVGPGGHGFGPDPFRRHRLK
jgi:hypothetical protein